MTHYWFERDLLFVKIVYRIVGDLKESVKEVQKLNFESYQYEENLLIIRRVIRRIRSWIISYRP